MSHSTDRKRLVRIISHQKQFRAPAGEGKAMVSRAEKRKAENLKQAEIVQRHREAKKAQLRQKLTATVRDPDFLRWFEVTTGAEWNPALEDDPVEALALLQYIYAVEQGRLAERAKAAELVARISTPALIRRALMVMLATPLWVDRDALRKIYAQRTEMNRPLARVYEVDHIVPINNPRVCGLHVPWNLRIITMSENRKKRNKLEES